MVSLHSYTLGMYTSHTTCTITHTTLGYIYISHGINYQTNKCKIGVDKPVNVCIASFHMHNPIAYHMPYHCVNTLSALLQLCYKRTLLCYIHVTLTLIYHILTVHQRLPVTSIYTPTCKRLHLTRSKAQAYLHHKRYKKNFCESLKRILLQPANPLGINVVSVYTTCISSSDSKINFLPTVQTA